MLYKLNPTDEWNAHFEYLTPNYGTTIEVKIIIQLRCLIIYILFEFISKYMFFVHL